MKNPYDDKTLERESKRMQVINVINGYIGFFAAVVLNLAHTIYGPEKIYFLLWNLDVKRKWIIIIYEPFFQKIQNVFDCSDVSEIKKLIR